MKYISLEKLLKKREVAEKRRKFTAGFLSLPSYGSVKSQVQEVYDQGQEGSCTANAFCGAYRIVQSDKTFVPSRQYVYYKERLVEGGDPANMTDSGANVEDAVSWIAENGVCSEASWPYSLSTVDTAPPESCDEEAKSHKLGGSYSIWVGDNLSIKQAICNGLPVMIAIAVYESFESPEVATTGVVPIPQSWESCLGGHEILIVGYNDSSRLFTVLNSWGSGWGDQGFCYLPYDYVSDAGLTYQLLVLDRFTD